MADDARILNLERWVQADPASIAFAQLGEEYRRSGRLDDAIRVCRAGLTEHPSFPSARVTLGRALLAQGLHEEARLELEAAAGGAAPDHVGASRAMEEWRRATGRTLSPGWEQRTLQELEGWLVAIGDDRAQRQRTAAWGEQLQD